MEASQQNIEALVHYLGETLSPDKTTRRAAEAFLNSVASTQGYPNLLLHLLSLDVVPGPIKHAAAITFKILIRAGWEREAGSIHLAEEDRTAIKALVLDLMLVLPDSLQKQITEAIACIGKHDFPRQWESLLPAMVARMSEPNIMTVNAVLRTMLPLCRRYSFEFKSDELWLEIKYVLDLFADPLTKLYQSTFALLEVSLFQQSIH